MFYCYHFHANGGWCEDWTGLRAKFPRDILNAIHSQETVPDEPELSCDHGTENFCWLQIVKIYKFRKGGVDLYDPSSYRSGRRRWVRLPKDYKDEIYGEINSVFVGKIFMSSVVEASLEDVLEYNEKLLQNQSIQSHLGTFFGNPEFVKELKRYGKEYRSRILKAIPEMYNIKKGE